MHTARRRVRCRLPAARLKPRSRDATQRLSIASHARRIESSAHVR